MEKQTSNHFIHNLIMLVHINGVHDSLVVSILDCQIAGWGLIYPLEISVSPSKLNCNEFTDCTLSEGKSDYEEEPPAHLCQIRKLGC